MTEDRVVEVLREADKIRNCLIELKAFDNAAAVRDLMRMVRNGMADERAKAVMLAKAEP